MNQYKININLLGRVFSFLDFYDLNMCLMALPDLKNQILPIINKCDLLSYDIALIIHRLFSNDFVYPSSISNNWYQFHNHRWREIDIYSAEKNSGLTQLIIDGLSNELWRLVSYYNHLAVGEKDQFKDQCLILSQKIINIFSKFSDLRFKMNVISACKEMFYDKDFLIKIDTNPNLIGFENGIYNLKTGKFRAGQPKDYVSLSTKTDFIEFLPNDPKILAVKEYLSHLFPNKSSHEVLTTFSNFLSGNSTKLNIWKGSGSNGRSKLSELFRLSFGDYCGKVSNAYFQKSYCEHVTKRIVIFLEPTEYELRVASALMEKATGRNILQTSYYCWNLPEPPQFDLIIEYYRDEIPTLTTDSKNLQITNFTNSFVKDPNPSAPQQLKRDPHLNDKLSDWKEAFMYLLLDHQHQHQHQHQPQQQVDE